MRKIILIFIMLAAAMSVASAQSVSRVKSRLSEVSAAGGRITVAEDESASAAVRQSDLKIKPSKVRGYRVVIFFDNGQYASDKARSVMNSFNEKYPSINAYLVYESPYFKVSVGNCLTMEEAVILMNRVSGAFPTAFPKSEQIELSELTDVKPDREEEPAASSETDSGAPAMASDNGFSFR
ncbi:MAG: hypothetical protein K2J31_04800 [Alistipes sp.]|nr:hypothetical protein [Alistipes sp.]